MIKPTQPYTVQCGVGPPTLKTHHDFKGDLCWGGGESRESNFSFRFTQKWGWGIIVVQIKLLGQNVKTSGQYL